MLPGLRLCLCATFLGLAGLGLGAQHLWAQGDANSAQAVNASFTTSALPFLDQNCMGCHKGDAAIAGLRVDQLNGAMDDGQMETWERVYRRIANGTMPPANARQPSAGERRQMVQWLDHAMAFARTRPTPRNGLVRRLTVAQYRNTLRDLLKLDDDMAEALPPDALSKEGFLNNQERLQLSPQLVAAYFEIADRALGRVIIDPARKPTIENFRVELGAGINRNPTHDRLILGPGSYLLDSKDFTITQRAPAKPFAFTPFAMQTKFRFVEGYLGNNTVRGWKEFNGLAHAVFADFSGSKGYPKGKAWEAVPQGLLLRPAIPSEDPNGSEGFGPKANFKIAVRELPSDGRFRVTVTAAKYDDGLLLDSGARAQPVAARGALTVTQAQPAATIAAPGVYQVDVYPPDAAPAPAPDGSRLAEGLVGDWNLDGPSPAWKLRGEARSVATPLGKGIHFDSEFDSIAVPYSDELNVGKGDFTISGWIKVGARAAGIISAKGETGPGWTVESTASGAIQILTYGPDGKSNGVVVSNNGVLLGNWQHFAIAVRRGTGATQIFIDGALVGQGTIANGDIGYRGDTVIGVSPGQESYGGDLDDFRFYRRALAWSEVRALAVPKVALPKPVTRGGQPAAPPTEVALAIGNRQFTGNLQQPAFLAVRLAAGTYPVTAAIGSLAHAARIVLTPLDKTSRDYQRFVAFEKRAPRIGLYMGFRRDCGETMKAVGEPQDVPGTGLKRYVFEGAMRNFPNPDVGIGDANYISGIRQIGVRSEYTDGRDMPRLVVRAVEFEGPYYDRWPSAAYTNIFGAAKGAGNAGQARQIIRQFATRAFRRPLAPEEEKSLLAVYRASTASGRSVRDGVKDALVTALTMPQFLFLVEKSATPAPEPLDNYELASKLSYFLWNGPPDQHLLRLAGAGTLRGQLHAEVARMVADARFNGFLKEFVPQWLSLDKFQVLEPDRRLFPALTHAERASLMQEPVEYVRYLIAHNLPASDLVKSDFVVMNEAVAGYYGLGDKVGSGFRFVALKPDRPDLGGIMTQAAVLSGLSDGRESNPVRRGAWLARKIIAQPPPNPPPNVPPLQEDAKGLTLRQRIEQHRSAPACRSCHTRIDPWGIAFEEYDAGGRLKTQKVDARSTLPDGADIAGVTDLKAHLVGPMMDEVGFSVLKHLTTYAAGRSLSYAELDQLRQGGLSLKKSGYRLRDMIQYVASTPMFLEK